MLLTPGGVAVELTGPPEDVVAPEGLRAARRGARPSRPAPGWWRRASRRRAWATWPRALEDGGLDYEARMGVGTCPVAVDAAAEVAPRCARRALGLGGHAVVSDGARRPARGPLGPAAAGRRI